MMTMVISGISGGFSSILGKIALSSDSYYVEATSQLICSNSFFTSTIDLTSYCWLTALISKFLFFILMLYCNVIMLSYFLNALETRGSLPVTVVCSAVNFLVTGLLGNVILGENVNIIWCGGAGLIISGIVCILYSQGSPKFHV